MPAKSEKQRKLFGAALACRKGKGKCKGEAEGIASSKTSTKDIKDMTKKESIKRSGKSIQETCGKKHMKKKVKLVKESADKAQVREFIDCIFKKDFAEANKHLNAAVRIKTKNLIKSQFEGDE